MTETREIYQIVPETLDVRALDFYFASFVPLEQEAIRVAQHRNRTVITPSFQASYHDYTQWQAGAEYLRERLATVARLAAEHEGDLVEIGSFLGETSVLLAAIAKEKGKKLLCVDPYQTGTQDCGGSEYEIFLDHIQPFGDTVEHVRLSSQDERAIARLKDTPLCFALVDGLHTYNAAYTDMLTVRHARVVAVDDMWMAPVAQAFKDFPAPQDRKLHLFPLREAYLVNL